MKVLFHLPVLPPKNPRFEAYSQEIAVLGSLVEGKTVYINPNQHVPQKIPVRIPRVLFGYQILSTLKRLDQDVDFHQIYNPDPYLFPVLKQLRKPIIYVISGRLSAGDISAEFVEQMAAIAVYDDQSFQALKGGGASHVYRIQSGIDCAQFTNSPVDLDDKLHLLMASAPWSPSQFETKGIDLLLATAQKLPKLHLTFLWRGVLFEQVTQRIAQMGLQDRVTVVDKMVDVNEVLGTVHGTIVLANRSDIVKAYPHSLLDSLAAGKPIMVSRHIPMSDYVEKSGTGCVVEALTLSAMVKSVGTFIDSYDTLRTNAEEKGQRDFGLPRLLDSYQAIYSQFARHPGR